MYWGGFCAFLPDISGLGGGQSLQESANLRGRGGGVVVSIPPWAGAGMRMLRRMLITKAGPPPHPPPPPPPHHHHPHPHPHPHPHRPHDPHSPHHPPHPHAPPPRSPHHPHYLHHPHYASSV